MNEGDELLAAVRQHVAELQVPLDQREAVTVLVARSVVTIMSNPRFFYRLAGVQRLQAENIALRQHIMLLQATKAPAPRKRPAKKAPAKKAAAKRVVQTKPPVRVRSSQSKAFKRGARGG
jgi:hypothetical protein